MMILRDSKERSRFLRFAVVGMVGAVVDFGTFNLMTKVVGLTALISSVISFTLAVISNFTWNRYWTYPDSRSKHMAHQVIQFAVVNVIGLVIRTPLFAFLEPNLVRLFKNLALPVPLSPTFLGYNFSLAIAVVVVMMWNFFVNRYWTYSDVMSSGDTLKSI